MNELGDIITAPSGETHVFIGVNPRGGVVTITRTATRMPNVYVDFEPVGPVRAAQVVPEVAPEPEPEPYTGKTQKLEPVVLVSGRWTDQEIQQLIDLDGRPLAEQETILCRSVAAIKHRRKLLRQAGMLGVWSGAVCYCGRPAVAKGRCHNHYQQVRQRSSGGRFEKASRV
jgi:hypothetical protein